MTARQLRAAIRGRAALVQVAGTEIWVRISQREAEYVRWSRNGAVHVDYSQDGAHISIDES